LKLEIVVQSVGTYVGVIWLMATEFALERVAKERPNGY